jgi:hypothetical protein
VLLKLMNQFFHFNKGVIYSSTKVIVHYPLTGLSFISVFLLVCISPVISLAWLCIPTLYFLCLRNYKSVLRIWLITIGTWYAIFTTSLSEITILIGFEHTKYAITYMIENDLLFSNLCFQTVYLLDLVSDKIGFTIYVPSAVNIITAFTNFFKANETGCAPGKGDSGDEKKNSPPWYDLDAKRKKEAKEHAERCEKLSKNLNRGIFGMHAKGYSCDGKNTTKYSESYFVSPLEGFKLKHECRSRPATDEEKVAYDTGKRDASK